MYYYQQAKTNGYDSHESPLGFEWVIFDSGQCCPTYLVEFKSSPSIHQKTNYKGYEDS